MSQPSEAPVPDTMEGLRRQNSAYRALCASLEDRQAIHTAEGRKYHEAVSTLESERQANAILTEENARLTKERDMAVEALRASLPVMERELNHLLESCCLLDKETLEPIRETLEGGVSDVVLDMEDGIAKARAVLTQIEASKGEG